MYVLGINAAWHDSSACLVHDGRVVAAAEEERFTGVKHGKTWGLFNTAAQPYRSIDYCLAAAGIQLSDVDHIAYAADPALLQSGPMPQVQLELPANPTSIHQGWLSNEAWWTIHMAGITHAPHLLIDDVPWHLRERWGLGSNGRDAHRWQFHWVEHHLAHAASAFLPSPFERAAILSLDGAGEQVSTVLGVGNGSRIDILQKVNLPHSLGKFYEAITTFLGFLSTSDEYKVMALASYGKPVYADAFRDMFTWFDDGRYEVHMTPFQDVCGPARKRNTPMEPRHFDIAASAQLVLEEYCLKLAHWLHARTGEENLCLAGGVALNCVMNSRLTRETPFRRAWTQPASGDAGTALGAALWLWQQQSGSSFRWRMQDAYLGPEYSAEDIEKTLKHAKLRYQRCDDIAAATAECLAEEKIVGWFQGRMEFGPRALGARSIIASPRDPAMMQRLNELKDREDFRPVAPAVLEDAAGEYFADCSDAPFMTFVYQVRPEKAQQIPAIRHVDGSARVQTVNAERSPRYHRMISRFRDLTGVPVVVNTSFNSRGLPIVCTPQDALECFYISPIDALAIGDFLLVK